MPICWAVFQKRSWIAQNLDALGGGHVTEEEESYMLWLGEEQTVFGEKSSNAVAVASQVLQQMSRVLRSSSLDS